MVLTTQLMSKPKEYVVREAPARRSGCSWSSSRARGQSRAEEIAAVKEQDRRAKAASGALCCPLAPPVLAVLAVSPPAL